MVINQINNHKGKIYNHHTYTKTIIKKIYYFNIYKKILFLLNIRMINLSLNELKLIAQIRNISDYENKSKEDLIKALSEPKSESPKPEIPKPEIPKLKTLKLKTPKLISSKLKISKLKIPKPKPRPEIRVNKKKLKKLRKDFDELRHKFSNKDEIKDYRKAFHIAKNYKHLFESEIKKKKELLSKSEIEKVIKHINKLKKA